jgi:hypothetical protein
MFQAMFLIDDGLVMRHTEITVIIGCGFNYRWLPFDWQECEIQYYSAFDVENEVLLSAGKFKIDGDIDIPEWDIIDDSFSSEIIGDGDRPGNAAVNA